MGRAVAICPRVMASHEVRPGALTRPRRPRPTVRRDAKTPVSRAARHRHTIPSAVPAILATGPEMTARLLRTSFVRAVTALLGSRPSLPIGDGAAVERNQKPVSVGSANTRKDLAGVGASALGDFAVLAAGFWRGFASMTAGFHGGFGVVEGLDIFVSGPLGIGVRLAGLGNRCFEPGFSPDEDGRWGRAQARDPSRVGVKASCLSGAREPASRPLGF